jgi:methionyl-tRNA synthetase
MSTSRGWVLWLHDLLEEFHPDLIRFYLLSINPEKHDSDFSLNEFRDKVNQELVATLGNFINRVLTFIHKEGEVIPKPGSLDREDKQFLDYIDKSPAYLGESIEGLRLREALARLLELSQRGNEYFQKKEPWKNNPDTTLFVCVNALARLAVAMEPFLPLAAEKLWGMLGKKDSVHSQKWNDKIDVKAGVKLPKPEILFTKLEKEAIEGFKTRHLPTSESTDQKKSEGGGNMTTVELNEFNKLDLRVGEIKKVEQHPNAEKLLVLTVNLGGLGVRQLVAGIKEKYSKKELEGRQIIVVSNLEPAKIRGVESQGMLLAAVDDEGGPILLQPDRKTNPGAKIK